MSPSSSPPHARSRWAAPALLLNALVWGLSWWPLRELQGRGLHPLWSTVVVYLLAAFALLAWRPQALRQLCAERSLLILAAASGTTNAAFNWAVSIGDVVRVVLLFYLMPVWSVLLARVLLGERFTLHGVLRVGLALAGAVVVLKPESAPWPVPHGLSDWLALLGGFSFAFNSVMLRRLATRTREEGRAVSMLLGCVFVAGAVALVIGPQRGVPGLLDVQAAWLSIAVGLALAFVCSNMAYQFGAARLPASVTSIVMLTEVVFAAASAVAWGGETLTMQTLLGGGMIVAAALLAAVGPARWGTRRRTSV